MKTDSKTSLPKPAGSIVTGGFPWRLVLIALLMLALVSPACVAQTAAGKPQAIQVAMDNAYPPFAFQSADGRLQGVMVDQWQAWEKKTGIKVEIHAMNWDDALRRMSAGEFDVIDAIVETPGRRDYFDFTSPYATIEASIFFRKDISGITDLASLKGFPVGVKMGDQHIDKLKENGVTTIVQFQNFDAIVEAAKQRKINVFLTDNPSTLYLLNKMGIENEFRHSKPIFHDELRRAVRKGDEALLRTVSEGFAAIDPGELKQIDEKWFGLTIYRYKRYLIDAGSMAAVAVLLIAGLAGWNRTLRKRVLQRTIALRESEQRYLSLFENMAEGVAYCRMVFEGGRAGDFIYLEVNRAFENLTGWTNVVGRKESEVAPGFHEAPPAWLEEFGRVATSGRPERFETYYAPLKMWLFISAYCPAKEHVIVVLDDITKRKQAGEALRHNEQQLQALVGRLNTVREDEAKRIAREIHDDLGQKLTGLKMDLLRAERKLESLESSPASNALLDTIVSATELADGITASIQEIASNLRPGMLDKLGLSAALHFEGRRFQERTGVLCALRLPETEPGLSADASIALFRIFQECLTNIARHAHATEIEAALELEEGWVTLCVRDNGRGITEAEIARPGSLGLLGMKERTALLGGAIAFQHDPGSGTTVTARIPKNGTLARVKGAA
ncbi:MAG: transporter substrate-binding domain-containing protein [Chthoniobacteraceae bacterium]